MGSGKLSGGKALFESKKVRRSNSTAAAEPKERRTVKEEELWKRAIKRQTVKEEPNQ
jgi:hypothetical protein